MEIHAIFRSNATICQIGATDVVRTELAYVYV